MYAIGIFISVIVVGLLAGTLIIQTTPEFTEAYNIYMDNYSAILQSGYSGANVGDLFAGMSSTNLLYFAVPYILGAIRFAIMLICGFRTNRMYFKHCIKKISSKNWVCFPCEAGVDAIQKLWYRIYTEFMPFSSYKINENETLEISFCKNGENQLYLYMPIKEDV